MDTRAKWFLIGAGAATVVGILIAGAVAAIWILAEAPEGIVVSIESPEVVRVGERFQILACVHNGSDARVRLGDLDFSKTYLRGVAIHSSAPAWRSSSSNFFPARSFTFAHAIERDADFEIILEAEGLRAGDWEGDADFWFYPGFLTQQLHTQVVE